ncbi:unnamed protein product [Phytomonas sp. Hart1]|nr:unnamed protein product [Phytomonas sp. Hart1]|eukprot:CCW66588.1 unnamed protein product [Phytomonas sp. isolate Hart1]
MSNLQSAFAAFASFGGGSSTEMDNSHFSKMLKESKIIGKAFTATDADLLFNKIKPRGERRVRFEEFTARALPELAARLKKSEEAVAAMIAGASPQANATRADAVKFHDDRSTYTGVYRAGGPTNVDRDSGSLAGVVDRRVETVDNRGTVPRQR